MFSVTISQDEKISRSSNKEEVNDELKCLKLFNMKLLATLIVNELKF